MKTTFGFKQFGSFNTPILAQKIGDLGLLCSGLAITIIGIPLSLSEAGIQGFVLPLLAIKAVKILGAIGVFAKIITKLIGKTTTEGQPVTTEKQMEIKAGEKK